MPQQTKDKKFRFIPYRRQDIIEMCLQEVQLPDQEDDFRKLGHLLSHVFHFEFHHIIVSLQNSYASIDPDSDTREYAGANAPTGPEFVELLKTLLEKANYERITQEDLNQALNKSSMFRIRLHVGFEDFSEVLLYCRGVSNRQETVSGWLGLMKKTISFTNYDRVVLYIRFRDDYCQEDEAHQRLCNPGVTMLKLFQNVPSADLEMLFPNTAVRMRLIDKLLIGVPAVVSGGVVLTTKMGASLVLLGSLLGFWLGLSSEPVELNKTALMVLLAGLVALGGYLWKQFNNFKNRKLRFMQALTRNLYFKNLDNNAGVFYRLANDAEEEECKEALLAYYFLLTSKKPLTKQDLDRRIEDWLSVTWQCDVDFEIGDAMNKLIELQLVQETDGMISAIPIKAGLQQLDRRWDEYFTTAPPVQY